MRTYNEIDTEWHDPLRLLQGTLPPAAKPPAAPAADRRGGYGKEQRRRKAELRSAIKALETEIEDLGATIMALEQDINDPDVLRDHLLLRDKCDALDDARFRQQECFDEWEKKSGELEAIEAEEAAV